MSDPKRAPTCWPIDRWPAVDQAAWHKNLAPCSPFRKAAYIRTRNPTSIEKFRKGYGRLLDFIDSRGWLDPAQLPEVRITPARLAAYFDDLLERGDSDRTVIGRIRELESAMAILAPGQDFSWITRPGGFTVYSMLPKKKRSLFVPDSGDLAAWGMEMMDTADATPLPLVSYRDGLIITMLAARARRLRSMVLLRVDHELYLEGEHYRIELTAAQTKAEKPDRFALPDQLTPYIRRYLDVVRPELLQGESHDAMWIGRGGKPLTAKGFQNMILKQTEARFGKAFGPQRFRHALVTSIIERDPDHAGSAGDVLGASQGVCQTNYNRSSRDGALARYAQLIERQRLEK